MPNREKPQRENGAHGGNGHAPDTDAAATESAAPAEPLNRAERRALARGKKQGAAPAGPRVQQHPGHHEQLVPRRAGRRGNR